MTCEIKNKEAGENACLLMILRILLLRENI